MEGSPVDRLVLLLSHDIWQQVTTHSGGSLKMGVQLMVPNMRRRGPEAQEVRVRCVGESELSQYSINSVCIATRSINEPLAT